VLQIEAGGYFGNDKHNLRITDTDILGADYSVRYGLFFEASGSKFNRCFPGRNYDH
jgi:hypothetical protein